MNSPEKDASFAEFQKSFELPYWNSIKKAVQSAQRELDEGTNIDEVRLKLNNFLYDINYYERRIILYGRVRSHTAITDDYLNNVFDATEKYDRRGEFFSVAALHMVCGMPGIVKGDNGYEVTLEFYANSACVKAGFSDGDDTVAYGDDEDDEGENEHLVVSAYLDDLYQTEFLDKPLEDMIHQLEYFDKNLLRKIYQLIPDGSIDTGLIKAGLKRFSVDQDTMDNLATLGIDLGDLIYKRINFSEGPRYTVRVDGEVLALTDSNNLVSSDFKGKYNPCIMEDVIMAKSSLDEDMFIPHLVISIFTDDNSYDDEARFIPSASLSSIHRKDSRRRDFKKKIKLADYSLKAAGLFVRAGEVESKSVTNALNDILLKYKRTGEWVIPEVEFAGLARVMNDYLVKNHQLSVGTQVQISGDLTMVLDNRPTEQLEGAKIRGILVSSTVTVGDKQGAQYPALVIQQLQIIGSDDEIINHGAKGSYAILLDGNATVERFSYLDNREYKET